MPEKQEIVCNGCQKTLRIPQKFWGKKVRCPQCSEVLSIPADPVLDAEEVLDDIELIEDDDPFVSESPYADDDPYADLPAAPVAAPSRRRAPSRRKKKKQRKATRDQEGGAFAFESRMSGSGILGGIALMALAFIWFFGALLFADRIFVYPPILFVVGLVAVIKGLIGAE